jgi:predicted permease
MNFTGALILMACALVVGGVLAFVGGYRRQGALMSARTTEARPEILSLTRTLKQPLTVAPAFLMIVVLCAFRLLPWWSLGVFAAAEVLALLGLLALAARLRRSAAKTHG